MRWLCGTRRRVGWESPGLVAAALVAAGLVAGPQAQVWASEPPVEVATMTSAQREVHVTSFDRAWEVVKENHFDADLGGVDWEAAKRELRPRAEGATTLEEARGAIHELLSRLGQSHFALIGAEAYEALAEEGDGPRDAETGMTVRVVDGAAVVTAVREGSPAAEAGVRAGWIITSVRGRPAAKLIERLSELEGTESKRLAMAAIALESRLRGAAGGEVEVEFVDGEGLGVDRTLGLVEPLGTLVTMGHMPPMRVEIASDRIGNDVGYIRLSLFMDPAGVMPAIGSAIEASRDAAGIVLDLRGNLGGIGAMAMGIGGWFITEPNLTLGTMRTRQTSLKFVLNPRPAPYTGKVAILVDELSMSTSEILAGGLKDLGRARVFGVRTPGAALPSRFELLPSGDALQYAFADYVSVGGERLEAIGVIPDEAVSATRARLLAGEDPALDAAVAWIRTPAAAGTGAGTAEQ